MPPPTRRVWCSCAIIDYLAGRKGAAACKDVIAQAEKGNVEIVVSTLAEAEVVKLDEHLSAEAEAKIDEFFEESYVVRAALDALVARRARQIVRDFKLKPLDAVHIATAIENEIEILETYDDKLIALNGSKFKVRDREMVLTVRHPVWEKSETPMDRLLRESGSEAPDGPAPEEQSAS